MSKDMVNVSLSIERTLDRAYENSEITSAYKHAWQLGYCEGILRDFIHRVMMEVSEERAVELMERSGIKPVYVSVEV